MTPLRNVTSGILLRTRHYFNENTYYGHKENDLS